MDIGVGEQWGIGLEKTVVAGRLLGDWEGKGCRQD